VFVAFFLISCEDALSPSEDSPLLDDPPAAGFWRLSGEVYAPPGWNPVETTGFFRIWLECWEYPYGDPFWVYLSPNYYEWTLVYMNQTTWFWTFDINLFGSGNRWFCPDALMWSTPDGDPPVIKTTYVRGYVHEDHVLFVLKDTDWSYQPFNPEWPQAGWKYEQQEDPHYYWWSDVSLDLTD